jgi:peroxin-19
MLDDFSAVKIDATKPAVPPGPTKPPAAAVTETEEEGEGEGLDEEFAKQLQAGMADLLGGLGDSAEMQAQFENIFKELGASAPASGDNASTSSVPPAASGGSSTAGPSNADASFQETIRRTMERMQTSGDQATAAATAEGTEDLLAELMKQMQGAGVDGGEGGEEEFSKMLMGMMDQLTTKEILYEPMKELDDKFPEWLEKNGGKTSAEDLKRYKEQQTLVKEIVRKFEEPGYSDSNKANREYIVDRMQQVSWPYFRSPWYRPNRARRCKPPGRRHPTLSGTCPRPRTRLTCQTSRAIPNNVAQGRGDGQDTTVI